MVTANTAKHPKFKVMVLDFVSFQGTEHKFLKIHQKRLKNP